MKKRPTDTQPAGAPADTFLVHSNLGEPAMISARFLILLLTFGVGSIACGQIHYVQRSGGGGTIALTGLREEAVEKARHAMFEHCRGNNYQITAERQVVVGVESYTVARKVNGRLIYATATRPKTELHITYACTAPAPGAVAASASSAAAPPPLPAPPPAPADTGKRLSDIVDSLAKP
jgi:hypothetical protein